jgi:phage repressor protein C with HTH and peptisase S24 domain
MFLGTFCTMNTKNVEIAERMQRAERLKEARIKSGLGGYRTLANRFGWNENTYKAHEKGQNGFGIADAKKYADAFGVSAQWLQFGDNPLAEDAGDGIAPARAAARPRPNASFPPQYQRFNGDHSIPVLGQTSAGPNGRFILNGTEIARVFCPPGLEGVEGAYAVLVYGTSMEPRFKAGETVWINPHLPVRQGDDVIAQILVAGSESDDEVESYIKEFRSKSAKELKLIQHNPDEGEDKNLTFSADRVFSVHKIVFHATL